MSQTLKDKLYHFSAIPPERTWSSVAEALDEQEPFNVQRLSNFEEVPASHNWEKITAGLEAPVQPKSATPLFRLPRAVKIAVAAVVLGLVAFGIIRTMNTQPLGVEGRARTEQQPQSPAVPGEAPVLKETLPDDKKAQTKGLPTSGRLAAVETAKATREIKLRGSRYVTINNEEGKTVRLSKKAYTMMACAENPTAVNYNNCKENIQMMQQKMSGSLISASGDFGGLVDMVKSLEEKN